MKIGVDLHVHTIASGHAYSTITEIVEAAKKKGIEGVAILDHGPALPGGAHEYYFSNLIVLPEEIEGVRVLKGAEVNIIDEEGNLDISDFTLNLLDFVGISFHPNCGYEPSTKAKNTEVLLKAMENQNVSMLCHAVVPEFEIELKPVVEAAREKGILIEINNFSFNDKSFRFKSVSENYRLIELCAETGAPVAVTSDAHYHEFVGEVSLAVKALKEVNFPEELVVNTDLNRTLSFIFKLSRLDGGADE